MGFWKVIGTGKSQPPYQLCPKEVESQAAIISAVTVCFGIVAYAAALCSFFVFTYLPAGKIRE